MAVDVSKLREKSVEELALEEKALRNEVWKLRVQQSTGQLLDHHKVRRAKRDSASVLTIKRQRELSRQGAAAPDGDNER